MNIEINNFGVIGNANIDIAPLNILIGPNNSGKSFAARLIHCFNCNDVLNLEEELFVYLEDYLNENEDSIGELIFKYIQTQPKLNSKPLKIPFSQIQPIMEEIVLKYLAMFSNLKLKKNLAYF